MEKHVFQDVTGKLHDMDVLKQLYNLFKKHSDICETKYLTDFSMLETFEFNPKFVIGDMLKKYICSVVNIHCQPNLLQTFVFTFYEADNDAHKFEFSNNMMINEDITILCFLYHISYKREYDECETVQALKSLMSNKYDICIERRADDIEHMQEQNKITLYDIAFSYPSVTWDMACNLRLYTRLFDKFSDFDLPRIIFLPRIFSLLPHLEQLPLAILLAIALKIDEFNRPETYKSLSLRAICNDISISLSDKYRIFPERLKLELCMKWQIVTIEKDVYKYASCFTAYRQRAKDIIAKMKPDDPDLERVLSVL